MAEEGHNEDACYFDLRAFFDGIPHQRCLASLYAHGVLEEGKIHKWVTAWLGAGGEIMKQVGRSQGEEQGARIQEQGARIQEAGARIHEPEEGAQSKEPGEGSVSQEARVTSQGVVEGARRQEITEGARIQELEGAKSQELQLVRRRQRVILNGKASKWHHVTASIIQGSVLGANTSQDFLQL